MGIVLSTMPWATLEVPCANDTIDEERLVWSTFNLAPSTETQINKNKLRYSSWDTGINELYKTFRNLVWVGLFKEHDLKGHQKVVDNSPEYKSIVESYKAYHGCSKRGVCVAKHLSKCLTSKEGRRGIVLWSLHVQPLISKEYAVSLDLFQIVHTHVPTIACFWQGLRAASYVLEVTMVVM